MKLKTAYFQMHVAIFLWGFTGILGKLITLNEGLLVGTAYSSAEL
jgi:hypothetical protein